ncbi:MULTISPECIES: arabinose operon transcriptional regulator AraC [Edwardsiella]|uniref:Arabinose operon regulatory protein n=2 Tax=Edwardsiella anguillarum TaxID=1821960 RepID=A0A076LT10_9GAMM|nr:MULTISPECIES: arabinose operon transcriptional regulator AraC [Edwardsiella]AKM48973.1 transcriptional regulator [Edwardsiella sp. EA181011]GAJ68314.1 DNA-binding transcriptional regulator AraC [Edwardsiella piscicida]AIJ09832.1 Arabinose operon regulatory protein [Edwardsiella anguillarum ET080813]AKR79369.1 arabinose operon transcriptional regulator AraC [Edwardsiella sp. LADL05-105]UOU80574.1 arabinose operon transcriptional regulator AraC [Edwardsiella anguillarum]
MAVTPHDKPQQLNPLLPGYDFDIFLVSGLTPIEQGSPLDFMIDRPHGMKGYIINLTIRGKGHIVSGEQHFDVMPGELLLFPPGIAHDYGRAPASHDWYHRWVYFRPRAYWIDWLKWPWMTGQVGRLSLGQGALLREFEDLFISIAETHQAIRPMSEQLAMNLLERLLIRCYEIFSQADRPTLDLRVQQACQLLNENLAVEISIEALAEQVFLSSSRLAHLFRQQVGVSIVRWREDQRITRAKLLLQTTPLTVAVIGQQVGYDDQLYFSRVFRKRVGVSPSEYRRCAIPL